MTEVSYIGYPPPLYSFWATDPLDQPPVYPDYPKAGEVVEEVQVADDIPPLDIDWHPASPDAADDFEECAVKGGVEGWDGSPLWVIRSHVDGNCIPGKMAAKHKVAYIPYGGAEVEVSEVEVLQVQPNTVRWLPASYGRLPLGALIAGNTADGQPLYIGRARQGKSLTPGYVNPKRGGCVISFSGKELIHKSYEVLCQIAS